MTGALNHTRILPDFVIIGAQKCGTTSLFSFLSDQPGVVAPVVKEIRYFDRNFLLSTNWYRSHFPSRIALLRQRGLGRGIITGEATPYYMFHPLVPERMAKLVPNAKLIVLLRNPVDRAYSHYQGRVRNGAEPLSFADALRFEDDRTGGEVEKMLQDDAYVSATHSAYSYKARGIYVEQLKRWERLFPKDQMLIVRSDDLFGDAAQSLSTVLRFLGIAPNRSTAFPALNRGDYVKMDPSTRAHLVEFFRSYNQQLYEHVGLDFGWDV